MLTRMIGAPRMRLVSRDLKQKLFTEYGGFADKRYKKIETDAPFQIDDRNVARDFAADKSLYLWFCEMHVHVNGPDAFELRLSRGVPLSEKVSALVAAKGGTIATNHPIFVTLAVQLTVQDGAFVRSLAEAIEDIVRFPPYSQAAYKYVCPRTAASLRRLADLLDAKVAAGGDNGSGSEFGHGPAPKLPGFED